MDIPVKLGKHIELSIRYGFYGKRYNLSLSLPWAIGIGSALLLLLLGGLLYLGMLMPYFKTMAKLDRISAENRELREKLDIYSAALDSIATAINPKAKDGLPSVKGNYYPYTSSADAKTPDSPFAYDDFLNSRITQIESSLTYIFGVLHSQQAGALVAETELPSDQKPSIYPTFGRVSDGWGMRIHPVYRKLAFHYGLDLANAPGTPIYATASGKVVHTGYDREYGKLIKISHNSTYETRYGHLYSFLVREGDIVKRGQIIGLMGDTGVTTGPHLHYEVLVNGAKVNPGGYLNRLDEAILVKR